MHSDPFGCSKAGIVADVDCTIDVVTYSYGSSPSGFFLYASDFTLHDHAVGFDRLCSGAPKHRTRAHVVLSPVPRTGHRRSVEFAFIQWTSPMSAFRLCGTEIARDIEHRHIAD